MKIMNTSAVVLAIILTASCTTAFATGAFGIRNNRNGMRGNTPGLMNVSVNSESVEATDDAERSERPEKPEFSERPKSTETPELTEEQKAEMLENLKARLSEMLENGEITQEQYDEYLAKVEAGEMPFIGKGGKDFGKDFGKGGKHGKGMRGNRSFGGFAKPEGETEEGAENNEIPPKPKFSAKPESTEIPELTEEQKAEMLENLKARLSEMLENGEITQEQYDEYLAKVEAGEMPFIGKGGKDFGKGGKHGRGMMGNRGFGGFEKPEGENEASVSDVAVSEVTKRIFDKSSSRNEYVKL